MTFEVTLDMTALNFMIAHTGKTVERIIADGVTYGIYNELGTSKMAAHPFMSPAVEAVRADFMQAAAQVTTDEQAEAVVEKAARDVERGAKERAPVDTGALVNSIHVEE